MTSWHRLMHKPLETATRIEVRQFLLALADRASAEMAENRYRSLRTFFRFCQAEELLAESPLRGIPKPKLDRKVIRPLSKPDIKRLLAGAAAGRNPHRDVARILLCYDGGLRASEVSGLRRADVNLAEGTIIVRGKGARERVIPLGFRAARALVRQMAHSPHGELVFQTPTRGPIAHHVFGDIVERICRRVGLPRIGLHRLRHTFALHYVSAGGSPFHLQRMLGHSTLDMTRRYCELANADLMTAHRKYAPGDGL